MKPFPDYSDRTHLDYGICVLSAERTVLYQNDHCRELCETQVGGACTMRQFTYCKSPDSSKKKDENFEVFRPEIGHDSNEISQIIAIKNKSYSEIQIHSVTEKFRARLELLLACDLTKRQLEIAVLRVFGNDAEEICSKLNISKNTLKTHLKNLFERVPWNVRKILGNYH